MSKIVRLSIFAVSVVLGLSSLSHAVMYQFEDENGITHFSDSPFPGAKKIPHLEQKVPKTVNLRKRAKSMQQYLNSNSVKPPSKGLNTRCNVDDQREMIICAFKIDSESGYAASMRFLHLVQAFTKEQSAKFAAPNDVDFWLQAIVNGNVAYNCIYSKIYDNLSCQ